MEDAPSDKAAMPPSSYGLFDASSVIKTLQEADLVSNSRIVMEKPFGTDLESAKALNTAVHEVFEEEQVFRIDHFLGKEAALNILAFRFANGLFEPIWHRNMIDHIQIDVPESLGLEQRAAFYEATGAYRDMVVTHFTYEPARIWPKANASSRSRSKNRPSRCSPLMRASANWAPTTSPRLETPFERKWRE